MLYVCNMKAGRPSDFSKEIADKICMEIATTTKSLKTICEQDDMPSAVTLTTWKRIYPEFLTQYHEAKKEQAWLLSEQIIEIADTPLTGTKVVTKPNGEEITVGDNVQRSQLMIHAREFIAAKLLPDNFGNRADSHPPVTAETVIIQLPRQEIKEKPELEEKNKE